MNILSSIRAQSLLADGWHNGSGRAARPEAVEGALNLCLRLLRRGYSDSELEDFPYADGKIEIALSDSFEMSFVVTNANSIRVRRFADEQYMMTMEVESRLSTSNAPVWNRTVHAHMLKNSIEPSQASPFCSLSFHGMNCLLTPKSSMIQKKMRTPATTTSKGSILKKPTALSERSRIVPWDGYKLAEKVDLSLSL